MVGTPLLNYSNGFHLFVRKNHNQKESGTHRERAYSSSDRSDCFDTRSKLKFCFGFLEQKVVPTTDADRFVSLRLTMVQK